MKKKTVDNLLIAIAIFATLVLIVMNVFTFNPVTLNVLRVVLAISWISIGSIFMLSNKGISKK